MQRIDAGENKPSTASSAPEDGVQGSRCRQQLPKNGGELARSAERVVNEYLCAMKYASHEKYKGKLLAQYSTTSPTKNMNAVLGEDETSSLVLLFKSEKKEVQRHSPAEHGIIRQPVRATQHKVLSNGI